MNSQTRMLPTQQKCAILTTEKYLQLCNLPDNKFKHFHPVANVTNVAESHMAESNGFETNMAETKIMISMGFH